MLSGVNGYCVRSFEDGDENGIVQLFDKSYRKYGGHVQKTPGYWRWCCLQRPDVEKNGVKLVRDTTCRRIVGYAVAGKSGNLWEMCYDPDENGKEIISLLLNEVSAYLETAGVSSITFAAPQQDQIVKKVSEEQGFVLGSEPQMFVSILDVITLVSSFADCNIDALKASFNETVLIQISDAPSWIDHRIFFRINSDLVEVDKITRASTIQLQTDYLTFSSLLFGKTSPIGAFVRLRLKIKPISKVSTALKILSTLQMKAEWSFQLSDYG